MPTQYFTNAGAITGNLIAAPGQGGGGGTAGPNTIVIDRITVSSRVNATTTASAHYVRLTDGSGTQYEFEYQLPAHGAASNILVGNVDLIFPMGPRGQGTGPRSSGTSPQIVVGLATGVAAVQARALISYHYE